jgi:hypothetical protein
MEEMRSVGRDPDPVTREALPITWPGVFLVLLSLGAGVWIHSAVGVLLFGAGYAWLRSRHRAG